MTKKIFTISILLVFLVGIMLIPTAFAAGSALNDTTTVNNSAPTNGFDTNSIASNSAHFAGNAMNMINDNSFSNKISTSSRSDSLSENQRNGNHNNGHITDNSTTPNNNGTMPDFNGTLPDFNGTMPDFNGTLPFDHMHFDPMNNGTLPNGTAPDNNTTMPNMPWDHSMNKMHDFENMFNDIDYMFSHMPNFGDMMHMHGNDNNITEPIDNNTGA